MNEGETQHETDAFTGLVRDRLRRRPDFDGSDPAWRLRALLVTRRLREARDAELDVLLADMPVRPSSLDLAPA